MNIPHLLVIPAFLLFSSGTVLAGMPSVLPEDLPTILRLNEEPHQRLQVISFFLLGIGLSSAGVMGLWNFVAHDFQNIPRLSFPKAISLVVLCGLLFVVVLTMISGARELMTPGAWKKSGVTYTLDDAAEDEPSGTTNPDVTETDSRP